MNLLRIFVQRPVLTTMLLLAFVVLGFYSYNRLAVEMMPNVEFPFVMVTTIYPGASPGEVESQVTKKIEDAVSTIANVKDLQSISRENVSMVFIEFELETDVDLDAIDVKDKVDAIQADMPEDAEQSVIQKFDIQGFPIIEIAVSAPRPLEEIYRVADKVIKERLNRIDGVAEVTITGKREREIRVEVDPERLRPYGLSLLDIMGVVAAGNLNVPTGHITRGPREITLRMAGEVASPEELAEFRLPLPSGGSVPLSEVADILDTTEELRESSTYNGQAVIGLSVNKRSDGNTVQIARDVYESLDELRATVDPDIEINISHDSAIFVDESVRDVLQNIMIGILLTAILLLIFLHSWRQTVIAAISMPTSVVATFLLLDASGFTVNIMTLMALGISIGTLVTNSIVVIENISRFVHDGMDPHEAAIKGTAGVAVAVMASTLTNMVVFTPIAFMSGIIGRFFLQFGLTVVYATIFSLIVCFTIVPMLSARLLKPKAQPGDERYECRGECLGRRWDAFYTRMSNGYRDLLAVFLRRRWIPITVSAVGFVFAIFLFGFAGGEFMPKIDQNMVIVQLELPPGTSIERTREVASRVEDILRTHPEVEGVIVKIGGGDRGVEDAAIIATLVDLKEREVHVTEFMGIIRPELAGIPDAQILVTEEERETGGGAELAIEILSNNQAALDETADRVLAVVEAIPGLVEVQTSREAGKPEINIIPRRRQLVDRDLTAAEMGMMLRTAYEGQEAGVYREEGEEYNIVVKYSENARRDPAFIEDIPIPSRAGFTVPLADVGEIRGKAGEAEIQRRDKQRKIEVSANIATGSLSEARALIDEKLKNITVPPNVTVQYGGYAEIQDESFASIFTALILAIVLIYIVMAAILESFIHPITVMVTLPLALIGVSIALFLSGETINIFSLMSVVMLVGIVVNNAILMLDYTAQLRKQGKGAREALLEACPIKLRPILMANLAIAVGMIPQMVGGAGLEIRAPMAIVQIGGVLISAFFTLFVIPAVYTIFDRLTPAGRRES
ncbi:MAG TPA: efflux RND transporter permease subunit [Patescibacteria group bacterium]|nr:efflux RND transporter permease subunit [Patescibacteria group bacterium]